MGAVVHKDLNQIKDEVEDEVTSKGKTKQEVVTAMFEEKTGTDGRQRVNSATKAGIEHLVDTSKERKKHVLGGGLVKNHTMRDMPKRKQQQQQQLKKKADASRENSTECSKSEVDPDAEDDVLKRKHRNLNIFAENRIGDGLAEMLLEEYTTAQTRMSVLANNQDGKSNAVEGSPSTQMSKLKGGTTKLREACSLMLAALKQCQLGNGIDLFQNLSLIESAMQQSIVKDGECIMHQGDSGDEFYVIQEGEAQIEVNGKIVPSTSNNGSTRLGRGHFFGELSLLYNAPRTATVRAVGDLSMLVLLRKDFRAIMTRCTVGSDMRRERYLGMEPSGLFKSCPAKALSAISSSMQLITFPKGKLIARANAKGFLCYLLEQGELELSSADDDEKVVVKNPGYFVGTELLDAGDGNTPSGRFKYSVTALTEVTMSTVPVKRVQRYVTMYSKTAQESEKDKLTRRASMQVIKREYTLADLQEIELLGLGGYGNVTRVLPKPRSANDQPGEELALKQMSKLKIMEENLLSHVSDEKQCMGLMHHPFLIHLHATLQDRDAIYFLMGLVEGPELYDVVQAPTRFLESSYSTRGPGLESPLACFYCANLISAIAYMDRKGVCHRDLKCENVLLAPNGYLKIIDLGFAKRIPYTITTKDGQTINQHRSFTMCGTPEYLAPEMIQNIGCTRSVDLWAFGVLLYELQIGTTPFSHENAVEMFTRILRADVEAAPFPPGFRKKQADLISLMTLCLSADPSARPEPDEVMQHKYFSPIDWDQLFNCAIKPPFMPRQLPRNRHRNRKKNAIDPFNISKYGGKDPFENW